MGRTRAGCPGLHLHALQSPGVREAVAPAFLDDVGVPDDEALGRSLQRNASAGDYFRHPRVVVAVTGEARTDESTRLLLKDRLFLGFRTRRA